MLKDECPLKNVKLWLGLEFHAVVKKLKAILKTRLQYERKNIKYMWRIHRQGGQETRILNSRIK